MEITQKNNSRENGLRIHAVCSYVVRQFEKPEYNDVNSRKNY